MIAFDFTQRPSISEIRQSTWMKEINWELMPLLKQEFISREEKININELYRAKIIDKTQFIKGVFQENKLKNNNINNTLSENTIEEGNEDLNDDYANGGKIKLKSKSKNLSQHIINIRRFLKKEGYLKFRGDIQKFELDVTNGEIDIFLNLL